MKKIYLALLIVLVAACSSDQNEPLVIDEAGILSGNEELFEQYNDFNEALLDDFDIDFRVITSNSNENINVFANKRFSQLNPRSKTGKTILLVINPSQNETRLEISMALEPIYTDALVSYIERKGMVPYFQDSKVADGIYVMSELIRDRATEAKAGEEFMPGMFNKSIGAGAKTKARIGEKDLDLKKGRNISVSPDDTPEDVWNKYFDALREKNKNPNLDIYTDDTKTFFSSWTVTDINQNNELRFASKCKDGRYYSHKGYAVLLYPIKPRTCNPYLFKVENKAWKLDFFTMSKVLRFNKEMMWHFDMKAKEKLLKNYEFSFTHFKYDKNGYPFYKKNKKLRWGFTCSPWYKPGQKDKLRCMITWLEKKGRAKNELGLKLYDRVMVVGINSTRKEDISLDEFMLYRF